MRESNFAFPSQNRASVCITSALYDRRALDCTAILPLINSLTHLTYLTSTSPRIREILTMDGGLERLIRILKTTKVNDKRSGWKWTMAFQCVANVGVRGSETIRTRVVDAGMVPVIITVLDNFLKALNHVRLEKEHHHHQQQMLAAAQLLTQNAQIIQSPAPSIPMTTTSTTTTYVGNLENNAITSTNRFLPNVTTTYEIRSSDDARSDVASWGSVGDNDESSTITAGTSNATLSPSLRSTTTTTTTTHLNPANNTTTTITTITNPSNSSPSSTTSSSSSSSVLEIDVLYREEDILLSLQLLAYLSKYPHIRTIFHSAYPPHNVFSLVERFTHRLHPAEIQYWAGVIMRNACRKDEARGGVRQCAYMACGKWESYAREFAKCRRCRKAKYCSKACQSKAWSEGHRWWCMERHSHADTSATTDNTNNTNNNNSNNNNNNNSNNSNNNNSNTNQNINNNNNNNNNGHSIAFGQSTTDTNNTNGTNSTNSSSNDNNDATSLNSGSGSGSGSILVSLS